MHILLVILFVALEIAAVIAAFSAIRTARTPQGSIGWVVFLLAAPYLALPIFLFLGHSRYPGYVSARRASETVIRSIQRFGAENRAKLPPGHARRRAGIDAFEALAEMPVVSGNSVDLLIDGQQTFDAILNAIDCAESYVLVQFYIIRDDRIGRDLKDHMIARAKAGCTVRLLYDAVGSHGLPTEYLADLAAAGVIAQDFNAKRQIRRRFQVNFRNHRKIVIVDGETGFVGGFNVGDEYLGRDPDFGNWRDTHIRLRGPAVAQLQLVFAEDWHWATEELLDLSWQPTRQAEDRDVLILAAGPSDPAETGSLYFGNTIHAAQERIWIATPYFVPDVDLLAALKLAALRGVDVRILVPEKRDHLLVWLAAFAYFDEVREAGVEIHRYQDGFLHQKVILVDDHISSIGTINLDNRSCRLNFEVTALIFDETVGDEVAHMLETDFSKSALYETDLANQRSRLIRLGAPTARLFAPVL